MAGNTTLTPTIITRESLRVLHNNLAFVRGINRQYNDQFAKSGGKIGSQLTIRMPNKYGVRTGAAMQTQNVTEPSQVLTVATQKGIDLNFTSAELTLSIDEFSARIIKPALARLASQIDYDCLSMALDVNNLVGTPGTTPASALVFLQAGQKLDENATPRDNDRSVVINPAAMASTVDALKGLFQQSTSIADQYKSGMMGKALGFDWSMDQNVHSMTCGSRVASATSTVSVTSAEGDTSIVLTGGGTTTVKKGDVFSIAGRYSVNPETGQSTGVLAQFVVTADATFNTTVTLAISPVIRSTGAFATVSSLPTSGDAVTFVGVASTAYPQNLAFHKDAFTLVTADLEIPKGVDFAARETFDGISLRIVRAYDINNDQMPCRLDILYGFKTLRPEMACRIIG